MKYLKTILSLALISVFYFETVLAANYDQNGPASVYVEEYSEFKFMEAPRSPLNLETLLKLVKSQKYKTLAETINALTKYYPIHMGNHNFIYDSKSAQEGTPENPRAMIFGPDAKLIFTFNGNPNSKGGSALEIISFDQTKKKFEFREIIFKKEAKKITSLSDDEIEHSADNLIISKANPNSCLQCHGFKDPRPIWEPYNVWAGVFGSEQDFLFNRDTQWNSLMNDYENKNKAGLNDNSPEVIMWKRFQNEIRPQNDRYKALPPMNKLIGGHKVVGSGNQRPNQFLTNLLTDYNFMRISRIIDESEKLKYYQTHILALMNCPSNFIFGKTKLDRNENVISWGNYRRAFENYFGVRTLAFFERNVGKTIEQFEAETEALISQFRKDQERETFKLVGNASSGDEDDETPRLIALLFLANAMGEDPSYWPMIRQLAPIFAQGGYGIDELVLPLNQQMGSRIFGKEFLKSKGRDKRLCEKALDHSLRLRN